ncbi:MAG: YceI family protein [Cellulomonadaceae bacterium]|nr:YceI family protein [Cellulomonadaceae bacterium]
MGDRTTERRQRAARTAADEQHDGPSQPRLPPEHRRRWLIWTMVAVVLVVGLLTGGPWVYARLVASPPPEPLTVSTPAPTATVDPLLPIDVNGAWTVGEGSEAGYRLGEVLTGDEVEVVGRTSTVTGSATVEGGMLTQAVVVVDTASITTDQSARDAYFRRALDTTTFPQATFEITAPVDVSAVGSSTSPLDVTTTGTLTFHGVSLPATVTLQVNRTGQGIQVAGQVPVVLADFGLEAPDLGFVTVQPTGSIEMLLSLVR